MAASNDRRVLCLLGLLAAACSSRLDIGSSGAPRSDEPPEAPVVEEPADRFPHVSPELVLDRGTRAMRNHATGASLAMAFDGEVYLVAWSEPVREWATESLVRAARVRADGTVLDAGGVLLAGGAHRLWGVSVAAGDGEFLVAWSSSSDDRADTPARIRTARVRSADGAVLDPGGLIAGADPLGFYVPVSAARVADRWVLVWETDGTVASAVLDPEDGRLDETVVWSDPTGPGSPPALATLGDTLTIAWDGGIQIGAPTCGTLRVAQRSVGPSWRSGSFLDVAFGEVGMSCSTPALATMGRNVVVAWSRRAGDEIEILAQRIDGETGAPVDPSPVVIERTVVLQEWEQPRRLEVTSTADEVVVVITDGATLHAIALDETLSVTATGPVSPPGGEGDEQSDAIALATDGRSVHVAWHYDGPQSPLPGGVRRAWLPTPLGESPPTRAETLWGPADQRDPALARTEDIALVVWREDRGNSEPSATVLAVRLRLADGAVLDDEPIEIFGVPCSDFTGCGYLVSVGVASDGADFFVAWSWTTGFISHGEILGTFVSADGTVDGNPLDLSGGKQAYEVDVAWDGARYAVVYRTQRWTGAYVWPDMYDDYAIRAAVVERDGSFATVVVQEPAPTPQTDPAVVDAAGGFVVAWASAATYDGWGGSVRAARVRDGGVSAPVTVADPPGGASDPTLGAGAERVLVAWEDRRDFDGNETDVYGTSLDPQTLARADLQDWPLVVTPVADTLGALAGDGDGFLLVYGQGGALRARRVDPPAPTAHPPAEPPGIDVQASAAVQPGGWTLFFPDGSPDADLLSIAPGEFLTAYDRVDERHGRGRARARFVVYDAGAELF